MPSFTRQNPPTGFYTYAYLREDGRPYYIGKGKDSRAWARHGSAKKSWQPPCDERILFLKWGLTEEAAHTHEAYLISVYGNAYKENGWLTLNFTDGGEGTSGYEYTDELREVRRTQLKGNSYGLGRVWSEAERALHSQRLTGKKKTHTPALLARHEALHQRFEWKHEQLGFRVASPQEMSKETGFSQAHFWRAKEGLSGQSHGWICLNPITKFTPKVKDIQGAVNKAAAVKNARGAAELGITLEEYMSMSYDQRYKARRRLRMAAA